MSEVTMQEFKQLCTKLVEDVKKKEALAQQVKDLNALMGAQECIIVDYLEQLEIEKIEVEGYVFSGKQREYAKVVDKNAFMLYLKERGQFEALATINAATAKKYYEVEKDKAIAEGNVDFTIDGMQVSSSTVTLSYKKAKK